GLMRALFLVKNHQRFIQHGSNQPAAKFAFAAKPPALPARQIVAPLNRLVHVIIASKHALGDLLEAPKPQKFLLKILLASVGRTDTFSLNRFHRDVGRRLTFPRDLLNRRSAICLKSSFPHFARAIVLLLSSPRKFSFTILPSTHTGSHSLFCYNVLR